MLDTFDWRHDQECIVYRTANRELFGDGSDRCQPHHLSTIRLAKKITDPFVLVVELRDANWPAEHTFLNKIFERVSNSIFDPLPINPKDFPVHSQELFCYSH